MKWKRRHRPIVERPTDRFIPARFPGTHSLAFCINDSGSLYTDVDILSQDVRESMREHYRMKLRIALALPTKSARFLLPRMKGIRRDFSPTWPVKRRKKPSINTPDCALDLPEFKAMYYFNLLDWGSTGYLAAALNWSVFLCHPDTNKTIHLTDIDNPRLAAVDGGEYGTSVKWDYVGQKLAIGTSKSNVQIWDPQTRKLLGEAWCSCVYKGQCSIISLTWSICNSFLISGCTSGKVSFIISPLKNIGDNINAHDGSVFSLSGSPDGKYLATSGGDNIVRIWTWPHLVPYFEIIYDYPAKAMAWHPWKSSLLAIGGGIKCGSISIYNINNCTKVAESTPKIKCVVLSLAWSGYTGELVASYWVTEGVRTSNGVGHTEIVVLSDCNTVVDKFMVGYQTQAMYLMWSPNGRKIATASADETLRIWNFVSLDMQKSLDRDQRKVNSVVSSEINRSYSFLKYNIR